MESWTSTLPENQMNKPWGPCLLVTGSSVNGLPFIIRAMTNDFSLNVTGMTPESAAIFLKEEYGYDQRTVHVTIYVRVGWTEEVASHQFIFHHR